MVAQPRPEQQQGWCRAGGGTWYISWLCSPGGVGCVGTVLMAGGARNGLAGPWCPDRADVSVSNTNSWVAVGPIKDCW